MHMDALVHSNSTRASTSHGYSVSMAPLKTFFCVLPLSLSLSLMWPPQKKNGCQYLARADIMCMYYVFRKMTTKIGKKMSAVDG